MNTPKVSFLLGAGASKGVGLPTSHELLSKYIEYSQSIEADEKFKQAVRLLVDGLREVDPALNFEHFLTTVEVLSSKESQPMWPFVNGLLPELQSLADDAPRLFSSHHQVALDFMRRSLTPGNFQEFDRPYLRQLVSLAMKSSNPAIYTLNYDLAIEQVLNVLHVPYANGFLKSALPSEDQMDDFREYCEGMLQVGQAPPDMNEFFRANLEEERWAFPWSASYRASADEQFIKTPDGTHADLKLVKVHGSLDWFRIKKPPYYGEVHGAPMRRLAPQDPIVRRGFHPYIPLDAESEIIIAGYLGKERMEMPYVELLRDFYLNVRETDILVVVGYSLSDEHVNRAIHTAQFYDRPKGLDVIVVNGPNWPKGISKRGRKYWEALETAAREAAKFEGIAGLTTVPFYAEEALNNGHLTNAIVRVLGARGNSLETFRESHGA